MRWVVLIALLAAGCNGSDGSDLSDGSDGSDLSDGSDGSDGDEASLCPIDPCIIIDSFPFEHSDDTLSSPLDNFDSYDCAPDLGEAGPEVIYMFTIETAGTLVAMLDDGVMVGADVDIHLLSDVEPSACIERGHIGLSWNLEPGTYFLVADSYSNSVGETFEGPYTLYAHFFGEGSNCAMLGDSLERIGASEPLLMPATGQVVKEAHLVTDQEFSGGAWPQSFTDGIQNHYNISESGTGYIMDRTEPWCPCCEPANEYGQGSSVRPPVEAEAFYVCMRWASAPSRGQRYIVFNGKTGKAVVAAAGYENGPGDISRIGGACEEIHDHIETGHLSVFTFGVAADQGLLYGPITCEE
jgi:hypothetical protein